MSDASVSGIQRWGGYSCWGEEEGLHEGVGFTKVDVKNRACLACLQLCIGHWAIRQARDLV